MRRLLTIVAMLLAGSLSGARAEQGLAATIYKNPGCECCEVYAAYLREAGIAVTVRESETLDSIKAAHGVPPALGGCHTMLIDGYVVEGHVPLGSIRRLLAERPDIAGIALPGMPAGSPGMSGERSGPFEIMAFGAGEPTLFGLE
jgi:hypothetical protein